jgi:hypothetical protein
MQLLQGYRAAEMELAAPRKTTNSREMNVRYHFLKKRESVTSKITLWLLRNYSFQVSFQKLYSFSGYVSFLTKGGE